MIQRKRILQQTGIFLKQNPGEVHLTTEELQQMVANHSSEIFLSKISRYLSNLTGSEKLSEKALKGYLAEKSVDHTESTDLPGLNQKILDGKKGSEQVCQYVDWLCKR